MLHLNRKGLIPASIAGALLALALLFGLAFASPARADATPTTTTTLDSAIGAASESDLTETVALQWSDGEEVSVTLTRVDGKPTYDPDSLVHGADTTVKIADYCCDFDQKSMTFRRAGFGDMWIKWWAGYPEQRNYVAYRNPDPPAGVKGPQESAVIELDLEWLEGTKLVVPVSQQNGNPEIDVDAARESIRNTSARIQWVFFSYMEDSTFETIVVKKQYDQGNYDPST